MGPCCRPPRVPGKPELLATTREFLDYFNLKKLSELPPLSEIKDFDQMNPDLFEGIDPLPVAAQPADDGSQPDAQAQDGLSQIDNDQTDSEFSGDESDEDEDDDEDDDDDFDDDDFDEEDEDEEDEDDDEEVAPDNVVPFSG